MKGLRDAESFRPRFTPTRQSRLCIPAAHKIGKSGPTARTKVIRSKKRLTRLQMSSKDRRGRWVLHGVPRPTPAETNLAAEVRLQNA